MRGSLLEEKRVDQICVFPQEMYEQKRDSEQGVFTFHGARWSDVSATLAPPTDFGEEHYVCQYEPEVLFRRGMQLHHLSTTAYPLGHRQTIWSHRVSRRHITSILSSYLSGLRRFSLYAHVPFCRQRCRYCEYTVVDRSQNGCAKDYHRLLLAELDCYHAYLDSDVLLAGFDIGGGTPSVLDASAIEEVVCAVQGKFNRSDTFDISIETTPRIAALEPNKMRRYRAMGIDRISMGLQVANRRLLEHYGRSDNDIGFNKLAVDSIRAAGFDRFNIDLMYGFAHQSLDDLLWTLDYTIRLSPEYITLYQMRYKGTRVNDEAASVSVGNASRMYAFAYDILRAAGYYAVPGKNAFSRVPTNVGTSSYLTERVLYGVPYLGLGLGAQTFTGNLLAYNHGAASKRLEPYARSVEKGDLPIQDLYLLPRSEGIAKMVSVSFYFGGINSAAFRHLFGETVESRFGRELDFALSRGLMYLAEGGYQVTLKGARCIHGLLALFYSPRVKHYLLERPKPVWAGRQ